MVYGDSIVHSAAPIVQLGLARYGVTLVDASVGGTAPCDALQFVDSDMVRYDPDLVVIAYVGNAFSPCINGTQGEDVYRRHYADTQRLATATGHRPLLFDTPPGYVGQGQYTAYDVLVYLEASAFGGRVVNTSAALLDPKTHLFENAMPCKQLPNCTRAVVRLDDDYHLTPVGAYLYAQVLTRAILKQLHLRTLPTFT